jgi:hypothetical protein
MSVREYAGQQGMSSDRLAYWVRRVEREAQEPRLLPVRMREPAVVPGPLELRSPSGWTMRLGAGTEPAWLAALLSGLR